MAKLKSIDILRYGVTLVLAAFFLAPFVWMASQSLKALGEYYRLPPHLIPNVVRWDNYTKMLGQFPIVQAALNTFFVTYAVGPLARSHIEAGALLAVAQGGGLVGRLGWGVVATRIGSAHAVIVALGLAMAAFAALLALAGSHWPTPAIALAAGLLGLTASGWNGVFLAEVARL